MRTLLNLFSLKLVTALLGLVYSILQVRYFGTSRTIEIYFAAQSLVYLVTSLTQSGKLAEIFLPEYHRLNSMNPKLGLQGLNVVINRMIIWGVLIMIVFFIFAPYFIKLLVPGFSLVDQSDATLMFRVLLPYLFLQVFCSFFITVLNAESKFGRAEFLGFINTFINIVILLLFYQSLGIWALIVSMITGKFIEFFFYSRELNKIGFQYKMIFSISEFDHISFFKTMQSTFLYVGATQVYSFVLTASISFLPEGTFAIFKYVQNLSNKLKGLLIQPFMTIFFTNYSNLVQKSKSVYKEFSKNMSAIVNVNSIAIIGTILLGEVFIDLLWGGKKFDASNVQLAYVFLMFNMVAVLISSIGNVYRKMAVAHGQGKRLYYYWVIAQLASAGFSYFLIRYFNINGLFFVIPINVLLMGISSYLVYKKTDKVLSYKFMDKVNLISIGLIIVAVLVKYISFSYIKIDSDWISIVILVMISTTLVIYPVMNIYKVFRG